MRTLVGGNRRRPRFRRWSEGSALLTLAVLAGCQPPDRALRTTDEFSGGGGAGPRRYVLGSSVEGREVECEVHGDGRDVVLLLATIHGNEAAGTPLLRRLAEHLAANPRIVEGRTVVLVPVANPDGMEHHLRNNARGVDLNRNFPAPNFRGRQGHGVKPLSEPESQALHRLLERHRPDRVVSIHQPTNLPACIDYDGPGAALAREMSRHTDLPLYRIGARPGSLGSYVGTTMGKPIITLEIPRFRGDMDPDVLWERYGRALLAVIAFEGPEEVRAGESRE